MHEQSETVQDPKTGKWVNVYGRNTPNRGKRLPGSGTYDNVDQAVEAARTRSALGDAAGFLEETGDTKRKPSGKRTLNPDEP